MDTVIPKPEPNHDLPKSLDQELFKFLREESHANRKALRDESDANRDTLLGTLKIVAYPLAVVLAIAGFMGWRSIDGVKKSIQEEAQQETKSEIGRMQEEIRQKLTAQFETPQLQRMVKEAAALQTKTVIRPLIEQEVSTDVSRSVSQEQHTINSTLISETQKAVGQMEPKIDAIVTSRVNATVDKSVDTKITAQVQPILSGLLKDQQVSDLVLRSQASNGAAFDRMIQMEYDPTTDADLRQTLSQAIRNVINQHNQVIYNSRRFLQPKTEEEKLQFLHSPDPGTRQAVLDTLTADSIRSHLDDLYKMMTSDPDLNVREAGFRRFKDMRNDNKPEDQIENLDNFAAARWWSAHRSELLKSK